MPNKLPPHLGGHNNKTHIDSGAFDYIKRTLNPSTMLDIGCSFGWMVDHAVSQQVDARGIDGDFTLPEKATITIHDYTTGPSMISGVFDLCWSVEFLEHVEEQYQDNYMRDFAKCSYVMCTAAPPGAPGHHHVNCRTLDYWQGVFCNYGFRYDSKMTSEVKRHSTMPKPFIKNNGMFFTK